MPHLFNDSFEPASLEVREANVSILQLLKDPPAFTHTVQHKKAAGFFVFFRLHRKTSVE